MGRSDEKVEKSDVYMHSGMVRCLLARLWQLP
jgi:hypothetical protein